MLSIKNYISRYFKRFSILVLICALLTGCSGTQNGSAADAQQTAQSAYYDAQQTAQSAYYDAQQTTQPAYYDTQQTTQSAYYDIHKHIPEYSGSPYVELNGNIPEFTDEEKNTKVFETYSELDSLGRCQTAYANVCQEIMPTEKRGSIGNVKPSGWHTVNYHELIDGNYLYNRCHLIAYELAGENANEKNLITGTRYLNVTGMLPFENKVAAFVKSTGYHVLYRVTPVFEGNNLVASGVHMEAWSVEDNGQGICFNIYVYNVQPGIYIDYATGDSHVADSQQNNDTMTAQSSFAQNSSTQNSSAQSSLTADSQIQDNQAQQEYVLNTGSKKFHRTDCPNAAKISDKNRQTFTGTRAQLIEMGYDACGVCKP